MACHSDGGGLWGSHDRHLQAPCDGYIICQFYWLSRVFSLLVTKHTLVHGQPLCACMVTECCIRFELGSCAVADIFSCAWLNFVGSSWTSLYLECSWLLCLNVDCLVVVVIAFLWTSCSIAPVVSVADKGFELISVYWWGGLFVQLVGWFEIFCCWVTLQVTLSHGQLVVFCTTVFQGTGLLLRHLTCIVYWRSVPCALQICLTWGTVGGLW